MTDENFRISSPLYAAHTVTSCWKCHEEMPVLALIAPNVIAPQVPEAERTVCILSFIEELPEAVLHFVRNRFPSFQFRYSKTTESRYYANTCPQCGVISGDWHLHIEPDGPFFPTTEEAARKLTLETIPIGECISVRAQLGMGIGDFILRHAGRL